MLPSTVGIVSYIQNQQSIFGGEQSQGSGIIISAAGYIVTNEHAISGATSIKVVLQDDSEYNATLVGSDERTDLAVLKIDATGLTPAEFGNSDQMQIGEQVIAIGNPGGLELAGTVTVGYVSAVNRSITTTNGNTVNCIQTDAAINPGNSAARWSTPMARLSASTPRRSQRPTMKASALPSRSTRRSRSSTT